MHFDAFLRWVFDGYVNQRFVCRAESAYLGISSRQSVKIAQADFKRTHVFARLPKYKRKIKNIYAANQA
jgi:hypothetical protein